MQFMAQVHLPDADAALPDRLALLFMCMSPSGVCATWEPFGANLVLIVPLDGQLHSPPADATHALRELEGVELRPFAVAPDAEFDGEAYEEARGAIDPRRFVLGHVGDPSGSVNEVIPNCPRCQQPMRFVVQLEEGSNHETAMNFGGGTAFAFVCAGCPNSGALLTES